MLHSKAVTYESEFEYFEFLYKRTFLLLAMSCCLGIEMSQDKNNVNKRSKTIYCID